jgi:hypothetical protein
MTSILSLFELSQKREEKKPEIFQTIVFTKDFIFKIKLLSKYL